MQTKAMRTYEKPMLTKSRVLLQAVAAQAGSPAVVPTGTAD